MHDFANGCLANLRPDLSDRDVKANAPAGYYFMEWIATDTLINGSRESEETFDLPDAVNGFAVVAVFEPEQELELSWTTSFSLTVDGQPPVTTVTAHGNATIEGCEECRVESVSWADGPHHLGGQTWTTFKTGA